MDISDQNLSHETFLDDLIKDVLDKGCAVIEVRLLLRWFGRKNWGSGIWKSLNERFKKELSKRRKPGEKHDDWGLYAIQGDYRVSLLCFSPDDAASNTGWWRSVDKLT